MSKETKDKRPKWMDDIDDESVKASLDAGIILPRLKPRRNQVYEVEFTSDLDSFEHKSFGTTYTVNILHDRMEKSLIIPKSFKFQLTVEMYRKKLLKGIYPDFKQLIGKSIIFQLTKGDTKEFKDVDLYSCQIK